MKRLAPTYHSEPLGEDRRWGATAHAQRGMTLIEALITLLVVSIGLLGVAALQVVGLQEGASAFRHSQATWLAYDMADRIRANIDPAALDPDDTSVGPDAIADHYDGIALNAASTPNGQACGVGNDCTRAQMVLFDTDQWLDEINDLPNGAGTVDEDLAVGGRYRIRVMWDEVSAGSQDIDVETGCPSDQSIDQACVEIWVQP